MEYVKLGRTGLDVSKLALGCMSYGAPVSEQFCWVLEEPEARKVIKHAVNQGINFFDTANCYSNGVSEEILGRAVKDFMHREDVVISTKVFVEMRNRPNGGGLSRKEIMYEVEQSLRRLGLDYVDILYIHRWDYNTPIEETMRALNDLVTDGKVRYLGASAMYAWQFQKAQYTAERHGWVPFVAMQNHYNLLYREEEREMIPLCKDMGVGLTPYSPLAAGRLSRDWTATTTRAARCLAFGVIGGARYFLLCSTHVPSAGFVGSIKHTRGDVTAAQPKGQGCSQRNRPNHGSVRNVYNVSRDL